MVGGVVCSPISEQSTGRGSPGSLGSLGGLWVVFLMVLVVRGSSRRQTIYTYSSYWLKLAEVSLVADPSFPSCHIIMPSRRIPTRSRTPPWRETRGGARRREHTRSVVDDQGSAPTPPASPAPPAPPAPRKGAGEYRPLFSRSLRSPGIFDSNQFDSLHAAILAWVAQPPITAYGPTRSSIDASRSASAKGLVRFRLGRNADACKVAFDLPKKALLDSVHADPDVCILYDINLRPLHTVGLGGRLELARRETPPPQWAWKIDALKGILTNHTYEYRLTFRDTEPAC